MKKDCLVTINSTQRFEDCPKEQMSLVTCATLYEKKGKFYISYDESALTGMEGTHTTVKLDGKQVTLLRTGTYPTQMHFCENQRQVGLYQTAVGAMTISVFAERVDNRIGQSGGQLTISYTVTLDHSMVGEHFFEMTVDVQGTQSGHTDAAMQYMADSAVQ